MPYFNYKQVETIKDAINRMAQRCARTITPMPEFTYDEMLSMLTRDKELATMCRDIRVKLALGSHDATESGYYTIVGDRMRGVHATFSVDGRYNQAPAMPRSCEFQILPGEKGEALVKRANEYLDFCVDWGRVHKVFSLLNGDTSFDAQRQNFLQMTLAQMRYVWPSLLLILDEAGMHDERKKVAVLKGAPRNMPTIPLYLRNACKKTSATITIASFLERNPPRATAAMDVRVTLKVTDTNIVEDFNEFETGLRFRPYAIPV